MTKEKANESFVTEFQRLAVQRGLPVGRIDGWAGERTRAVLHDLFRPVRPPNELPWMAVARSVLGLHETRDNAELRKMLGRDGDLDHDPANTPWCGEFVGTSFKLGLPAEDLPEGIWWARNWLKFGEKLQVPTYGCVVVFSRGSGGHVGLVAGVTPDGRLAVLGGNQGNTVSIAAFGRENVLGYRWPLTFPALPPYMPEVSVSGATPSQV